MNKKVLFNDGWAFAKSGLETEYCSELVFEPVDIPHDWLIYNTLALYENSIGWYRKRFTYAGEADQILLCFDGIYMDSTVYVNGQWVGEWKYGYSSFEHDITDAIVMGENEILVKVVHQSPNSRWYSGAGIYRNVWLKTRHKNHIITNGIYISTKKDKGRWNVEVETALNLDTDAQIVHTLRYQEQIIAVSSSALINAATSEERPSALLNGMKRTESSLVPNGMKRTESSSIPNGRKQTQNSVVLNQQKLFVSKPMLWSPDAPNLYQLTTQLVLVATDEDGKQKMEEIESVTYNIGFRTILLDPNEGFVLNGRKMKLKGVCEHHDLGALGAAFNKTALRRRFEILKDMGVNAIRTAHNMPAPELMDLADEMGLLVLSEAFDMWERSKTPHDYARFFKDWAQMDVKSWVMRDRNHPSLLMWSIGNEIYDTHADERGQEITRMLMETVQQYDPKGNARITIGSNYMPWENARKCADILKIAGYNYAERYYHKHHEAHPDWVIYGSETSSVVQSRGVYHFPYEKSLLADDDEQCSALGNSTVSWGAKSAEACIAAERDASFSLGQFLWTGFDYIGEPTPYHTKNAYFGQIDTATFRKDSFYIFQAAWTDYKTNPMVHILPYWDFNLGQMIDVRVLSNAPKIELQLNGVTIGTHEVDYSQGTDFFGWWKIPYEQGELKAMAYDEKGCVIASDVRKSFKDAKKICLKADKKRMVANGTDLIFVEITAEDEMGNPVENANSRVFVEVTGAGRLIGLDNGDSTDYDQYKGLSRRLFSGKLMAIIGSTLEPGEIQINVASKGLDGITMRFEAVPADDEVLDGISCHMKNRELPCVMGSLNEIPLRRIEISSDAGQVFDASKKEILVRAKLFPENTSYREVEWAVVNDRGIASNIAKVEASGLEARIQAFADGKFRLRCTSKNGSDKTKRVSQLEFKATGIGVAYKDPYGFITGGLYDDHKGEVSNGNEKGFATGRDGETQVGFRNIDFGPYGSDTITIGIFALNDDPYAIQIWEGMPDEEGSELLADIIYQKKSIWNVYQEETYKLSKRLRGITAICFVLQQKVHIKGFSFEKQNLAFEKNAAAACVRLYGDTYAIKGNCVEGIGNNVSLEFEGLDFGAEGATKLVINGRSPIDKNTIHIRFSGEPGESNQLVEFTHSDDYVERVFEFDKVTGVQKVTFLFLPGSRFDFAWFRFER